MGGLWSAQVVPQTVFEPFDRRNSEFARNSMFSYTFGCFLPPHGAPKQPQIALRRVLDRLGSLLFVSCFFASFWDIVGLCFGSFWGAKMTPRGEEIAEREDLRRVQDGHVIMFVWFFFRFAVWDRFWSLFGPSWDHFGALLD